MKKQIMQLLSLLLAVIAVMAFSAVYLKQIAHRSDMHEEVMIEDGWHVDINGEVFEDFNMGNERFPMLNKGHVLTLENKLPDSLPHHPVLVFRTIHSDIALYVNGEERYSYGQEAYDADKMIGYGYHYMTLDEADAGKSVKLVLRVNENNAFASLEVPFVADGDYVHRDFLVANRLQLPFILFLVIFGVVLAVVSVIYGRKTPDFRKLFDIAMFAVSIGMWSLCTTDIFRFFTFNMEVKNALEYISLYAAPAFVFAYFEQEIKNESKLRYRIYQVLEGTLIAFVVIAVILHVTNILHFPAMLKICHITMAIAIGFLIVRFFVDLIKGKMHDSIIVRGFVFLSLFVMLDLVRYNLKKYSTVAVDDHYSSMIYVGVVIFVVTLIADFCKRLLNNIYQKAEDEMLTKLAYTDALTGLYNRHKCEEVMDEIDHNFWNYNVVVFDLNNLKLVNDTMGHDNGDEYIRDFGDVLKRVFGDTALVGRSGGDEFYVIVPKVEEMNSSIEDLLDTMKEEIDSINKKHANWNMSVAYGLCSYRDGGLGDIRRALKIADQRMYKNKQDMKRNDNSSMSIR